MSTDVFFFPLPERPANDLVPLDLKAGLCRLVDRLGPRGGDERPWGLKVQIGAGGLPPTIRPDWVQAVADRLPGQAFAFDTLSINIRGLDQPDTHLAIAQAKGFGGPGSAIPYRVADAPPEGVSSSSGLTEAHGESPFGLAAAAKDAGGLAVLAPVRPHPHLGLSGAVAALGLGLADRPTKIMLHRDIRPKVDTPLCAGCGSCLDVCLVDAIEIQAGRAMINHAKCNGCGECMNVCFMAGISPKEAAGIPLFQRRLAAAAAAGGASFMTPDSPRPLFINFLLGLDRQAAGPRNRQRPRLKDVGILGSIDPVAVDQACWDLIRDRQGGTLAPWSGFDQEPETLLQEAEKLGLGEHSYRLVEI